MEGRYPYFKAHQYNFLDITTTQYCLSVRFVDVLLLISARLDNEKQEVLGCCNIRKFY